MSASRTRADCRIWRSPRRSVFSSSFSSSSKRSVQPTMAVSGVRSSWLTFCRKWSFSRLARRSSSTVAFNVP